MKRIYAALLFTTFFFSCQKESGPTTAEGKVLDITTGQPVPHATVWLLSRMKGTESGAYETDREFSADAAGNFAFSFEAEKNRSYAINAFVPELYFGADNIPRIDKGTKNKDMEVKIQPKSWLKFYLKDIEPVGNVTSFYIQGFNFPQSVRINWSPKDTSFLQQLLGISKQH